MGTSEERADVTLGDTHSLICPVCGAAAKAFIEITDNRYWRCPACEATFLDPAQFLSRDLEKSRYLLHENDPDDEQYRRFLNRLAAPLLERLPPSQEGLDYGCGPGPALARMMEEAGYVMAVYDPFFFPDRKVLDRTYDFIVCTEAAEHFHHPAEEFARLNTLLRPGGWLGVMTCFQTDDAAFATWQYRRDDTHVVFYCEHTFRRLAARFGWRCEVPRKDVVLLQKASE
jgi:SAM-dependent methyltransferase